MEAQAFKIVAPVTSPSEVIPVTAAGADELYCGAMYDDWVDIYGDSGLLSRRQGRFSHTTNPGDLARVVEAASGANAPVSLTLNMRYTGSQHGRIMQLAEIWEETGGTAIIACDPWLLLSLRERNSGLKRHLSLMAGAFNHITVAFFTEIGASRIILPRELTPEQMGALIRNSPDVEFETIAMYQKCRFIDSLCGFHHGFHVPEGTAATFNYEPAADGNTHVTWSHDPAYEGHGCQLCYGTKKGPVRYVHQDDFSSPNCAVCLLPDLCASGVRYMKVAGRGYDTEIIVRAVRFLSEARMIWHDSGAPETAIPALKELYVSTFYKSCDGAKCYYNSKRAARKNGCPG